VNLEPIFKAYDVRGVYPRDFNEDAAYRIGGAFARFSRAPAVIVGRDMRSSSAPLSEAFVRGVTESGSDTIDIGLVSTDVVYFASGRHGLPGAMFTASHNPPEYNGIKMCLAGAAPVGQDTGLADIRALAQGSLSPAARRGAVRNIDAVAEFADHLVAQVDVRAMRPLTVVVDAANGMAGKMVPAVFDHLPVTLIPLYFELDGTFPNHPADPIQPENLKDLQRIVLETGADLGIAFDGDADRCFLVDESAQPVSGSLTTALVGQRILRRHPNETVIHNVICSRVVREVIDEAGGTAVRSRVGHSFVKQLMASTGAIFGGEHSGHYYFRDNFRADSGLLAALYVLEAMSEENATLSTLLAPLRRYAASGEINTKVADQQATIERISAAYTDGTQDRLDGLTVDYADWWFNVRPSNTEPLLRLNVEATTDELMRAKRDEILTVIREGS
jgi:phosphomannomutase